MPSCIIAVWRSAADQPPGSPRRLMLPVSRDTLLRTVRRRTGATTASGLRRIGVDDWAWRKGMRYGTLICDLDRRCIVDLLPDREPGTVAAWLTSHTGLEIVARDRGGGYARAARSRRPRRRGRWRTAGHLMENASAAFLSAVRRCMSTIRKVVGVTVVDVALLTSAERLQSGETAQAAREDRDMKASRCAIVGRWRIVEADLWDRDFLDLCGPASMVVGIDGHGEISFGAVQVGLDIAYGTADIDFTWCGFDEMDEVQGSGSGRTPRRTAPSPSTSPTISATKPSLTATREPSSAAC